MPKSHHFSLAIGGLLACALLAGCATTPAVVVQPLEVGVHEAIVGAAQRADERRAASQAAKLPADLSGKNLSVVWEGEAKQILRQLADAQRMTFKVTGPRPELPLPVFIHVANGTLGDVLTAIGDQLGGRADVVLNDGGIELRTKLY